ncbi:MAG: hypothetical protein BVN35_04425 [Proteobacteria bacterium ST_bin11]|nr:MAG: hypothetical protein BVN35_04425 [Proteobacteria bacterium ST_bin11]
MRWYADNSELNGIRGATIPDILMFGGIAVSQSEEKEIRNAIEGVKNKYGFKRAPIKWNFKDLKPLYLKQDKGDMYEELLKSSKNWRLEIAHAIQKLDFKIVVSVVESHSVVTKTIKGYKPDLSRYAFSNGLMRFAMYAYEEKPDSAQIILDWPDKGDSKPFDSEYAAAYNFGKTKDGSVSYLSGPLESLRFSDSSAYVNMHHSTLMQLADLTLGATREVVECAIGKKASGFGVDFCKVLSSKYRGYPNSIIGRGISLASKDSSFKGKVKTYVDRELSV